MGRLRPSDASSFSNLERTAIRIQFQLTIAAGASGREIKLNGSVAVPVGERLLFHLLPETALEFPLFNGSDHRLHGTLQLELLDSFSEGKVQAKQVQLFDAAPGANITRVKWDPKDLPSPSPTFLATYRLRYTVLPPPDGGFEPLHGIIQLGPHIEDGFDIQGFPGGQFQCAPDCRFWVRVAEPNSGHPWEGVEVEASVTVGNDAHITLQVLLDSPTTDRASLTTSLALIGSLTPVSPEDSASSPEVTRGSSVPCHPQSPWCGG